MSTFPFLDLPVELAEQILLSTDVLTILRVMQTAHLMHTFVCDSEEIQYKIQLYYYGYVDAPRTPTSSSANRRTQLSRFGRQWIVTESTRNERLYLFSTFYTLESGVFVMFGCSSNCFFITRTQGPSRGISPLSWKTPSLDFDILTFGVDPTVNLLVVFGITKVEQRCITQIRLLTLTDCTPCPLATLPVLEYPGFPDCSRLRDSWSRVLVSGPWLGLAWREVLDGNWERLSVWDWKSGNIRLYIERVLAFSFISNKYLLTAHEEHLSVYDLSKEYPQFNQLDSSTEPVPVYQLALPETCHAAGLHRSGSLDHVPGSPLAPPPSDAADIPPTPTFTPEEDTSSSCDNGGAPWDDKGVPFYEDPSRNILAVNLITQVGHWPRVAGTMGTTIILPLRRLVDFAEEAVTKSTTDATREAEEHTEARGKAEAQMYLSGVQPPHHYPILELAQLKRQRRVELIRAGLRAATSITPGSAGPPRCFQPAQWLKHALVFNQDTRGCPYDYRRSIVSGSRFVSSIEVREGKRLFQLIEFNPTWVNALEQRWARPARDVGVHYEVVERGHPMLRFVQKNWETEGLIVPMTFEERAAVNYSYSGDSAGGFSETHFGSDDEGYTIPPPPPATPAPTPILSPSPIESDPDLQLAKVGSSEPSWYGWRVARSGEVKYAWKIIQASKDTIALDVAIQEDALIYTAAEGYTLGAHVYFAIGSF